MLDFSRSYGRSATEAAPQAGGNTAQGGTAKPRKPDAQLWLNPGFFREVTETDTTTGEETVSEVFYPLPVGLPLDTMDPKEVRSNSNLGAMFREQNNGLLQLIEAGMTLEPGGEILRRCEGSDLGIQIRRVNAKVDQITPAAERQPLRI